jgi:hypothetical protein
VKRDVALLKQTVTLVGAAVTVIETDCMRFGIKRVSLLTVAGAPSGLVIETSPDLQNWLPVALDGFAIPAVGQVAAFEFRDAAHYVRIRAGGTGTLTVHLDLASV